MKFIKCVLASILAITLSSCSKDIDYNKAAVEPFEIKENICYEKQIINIDGEILMQPENISSDGEHLYICDTGNSRIIKCDLNGEMPQPIGKLGNDVGEFVSPKIVAVNENKMCVYDYGNNRIQLLTKDGEYLMEYSLESFHSSSYLIDLEIDNNDKIYFSMIAFQDYIEESGVYCIEKDNYICIKPYTVGNLCVDDENMVYYFSKFEPESNSSWSTGYCEFAKISDNTFCLQKAISEFYSSIDTVYEDGYVYVYNSCLQCIDCFDTLGNYQVTVFREPVENDFEYNGFCTDFKGNFYLSDKNNNGVYKLKKTVKKNDD